jgi:plasmid stabilization system protein ParE
MRLSEVTILARALWWYRERSERAAAAFQREIEFAVERIGDTPTTYPIIDPRFNSV